MADKHKQSPLLSIGTLPMTEHDCDCDWESSDDLAEGAPADSVLPGDTVECANAATGSSTPAADSASAEDAVPGGSGQLCAALAPVEPCTVAEEGGDVESGASPAQANPDCACEPELPIGDVHSTSASEWEMVSKQEECV